MTFFVENLINIVKVTNECRFLLKIYNILTLSNVFYSQIRLDFIPWYVYRKAENERKIVFHSSSYYISCLVHIEERLSKTLNLILNFRGKKYYFSLYYIKKLEQRRVTLSVLNKKYTSTILHLKFALNGR